MRPGGLSLEMEYQNKLAVVCNFQLFLWDPLCKYMRVVIDADDWVVAIQLP